MSLNLPPVLKEPLTDIVIHIVSEIYKIVSQKQIRDSPDDDNSPSGNVQTISVAPTVNSNASKKQCCSV